MLAPTRWFAYLNTRIYATTKARFTWLYHGSATITTADNNWFIWYETTINNRDHRGLSIINTNKISDWVIQWIWTSNL